MLTQRRRQDFGWGITLGVGLVVGPRSPTERGKIFENFQKMLRKLSKNAIFENIW